MNDLTVSNIERQNILNNKYAVTKIQEALDFVGIEFEGESRLAVNSLEYCSIYRSIVISLKSKKEQ